MPRTSSGHPTERLLGDQFVDESIEIGVLAGFAGKSMGVKMLRVDERQRLIDENGGMGEKPFPHHRATKHISAVLADAAHLGIGAEEFLETPLVFEKPGEILRGAEFPAHVSSDPEAAETIF